MQGGLTRGNLINVRAEARSPFRLVRLLVLGGLSTGALVGLLIILGRLISAAKGKSQRILQDHVHEPPTTALLGGEIC